MILPHGSLREEAGGWRVVPAAPWECSLPCFVCPCPSWASSFALCQYCCHHPVFLLSLSCLLLVILIMSLVLLSSSGLLVIIAMVYQSIIVVLLLVLIHLVCRACLLICCSLLSCCVLCRRVVIVCSSCPPCLLFVIVSSLMLCWLSSMLSWLFDLPHYWKCSVEIVPKSTGEATFITMSLMSILAVVLLSLNFLLPYYSYYCLIISAYALILLLAYLLS